MMMSNVTLKLVVGSLVFIPLIVLALGKEPAVRPKLLEKQVVSEFSVVKEKLIAYTAQQQTCETDNSYMLSALKLKEIFLQGLDYKTTVSREIYAPLSNTDDGNFEIFHYFVKFLNSNGVLKKRLKPLEGKDFITSYIPVSEAPTSCYIFTKGKTLNLLCHYGIKQHKVMPEIIQSMIEEREQ